ncbi:MAG: adenosylcobinamide-GDP ribazoletransferase [Anaerolineales bacterium]
MNNHEDTGKISVWNAFWAAMQFLTITPAMVQRPFSAPEMGASLAFYPFVGFVIGLILAFGSWLFQRIFPLQLSAALILGLWIGLSGALHLDGFLDACDGLFGGWTAEKRLEIMHDEHLGAFAFAGGAVLLLVKFAALNASQLSILPLMLAPMLSRWGMVLAIVVFPYQSASGVGRSIKDYASWKSVLVASIFVLGITALSASISGWIALVVVVMVVWGVAQFTLRRIPSLTGDIYGAINELAELAVLLTIVACKTI